MLPIRDAQVTTSTTVRRVLTMPLPIQYRGDDNRHGIRSKEVRQVHVRPLDAWATPAATRSASRCARGSRRSRWCASWRSWAPTASTSTTTTWCPFDASAARARPHRPRVQESAEGDRAWSCRWRRRTCSAIRSSKTAPSPATTRRARATPSRRRCAAMDLGVELAPRPTSSGAAAKAPRATRQRPVTPSSVSARRSTSSANTAWTRVRLQVRPRGQAQRAARRHLPRHDRRHAGFIDDAGSPGDGAA